MSFSIQVRTLAAATTLLFLGACGGGGGGGGAAPAPTGPTGPTATLPVTATAARCEALRGGAVADPEVVPVTLVGQFEVPAVATGGIGNGQFTINRTTGDLSGSITMNGLTGPVNAAHIHRGFAGVNGGIAVALVADVAVPGKFDVPAATVLLPADLAAFLAGGLYTNAHTAAFPAGEVRGQIVPGNIDVVRCEATGDFEVPAITTTANAITYSTVNTASGAAVVNARTSGFTDANAAHLHRAFAGLNGPVVIPLTQTGGIGGDFWENTTGILAGADLTGYLAGETYVNIHTPANPAGHIRSQVVPKDIAVRRFRLEGGQEVPPVATGATGIGYITVNTLPGATHAVDANVRTTNLVGGNAAHIHQAATGVNGGVIVPLVQDGTALELFATAPGSTFTDAQFTAFLANQTYLNVHTAAFPGGEIRGQIIIRP